MAYRSKFTGAEVDSLLEKVQKGEAGGSVTVDSSLSTTSENPVMNKAITEELNKKLEGEVIGTTSPTEGTIGGARDSHNIGSIDLFEQIIAERRNHDLTQEDKDAILGGKVITTSAGNGVVPTISSNSMGENGAVLIFHFNERLYEMFVMWTDTLCYINGVFSFTKETKLYADSELSETSENAVQNKVVTEKLAELSAEIGTKEKALFVNGELNDLVKEVYTSTEGFDYKAVVLVKVRIAYLAVSKYCNAIYFHAADNSVLLSAQKTYATEAEALAAWNEGIFIFSDGKTYALVSPVAASVGKDFSGESLSHPLTLDFAPSISASLAYTLASTMNSRIDDNKAILKTCAKETYGVNLFDKRRAKLGIIDDVNIASSAKYYYSHPIYCEAGKYKQTPAPGDLSDRPSYAVCDENGEPIKGYYATNEDGFYIYTINEPCYIIVNIGRSAALDAAMFCKYDQYPSVYTPYTATLKYSNIPISNIIGVSELNPLTNKKMLICGDSIAYGGGRGYGILIGEKNSMQVTTHAIDGAIITIGGESTKSRIYQQLLNGADGMDYVILEGGVNDMTNDNLGEIENSFTAEFNEETFCGSFEKIISTMIAKYPTAKMGYVAVHRIKQWKDDNFTAWQDTGYYTKAIEICRKWGIPVCDLTHETPSLFEIKALKEAYTRNQDGWHPNEEGYRLFYCDKIEAWMKTL